MRRRGILPKFFFLKKDLPLVQTSMKTESLVPLRAVHGYCASDSFPDLIQVFLSNIPFPLNQAVSSLALKTDPEACFRSVTEVKQYFCSLGRHFNFNSKCIVYQCDVHLQEDKLLYKTNK